MTGHGVILFHTTSNAMQGEKILGKEGVTVKLIATPRHLSSDCGISLRFEWDAEGRVRELIQERGLKVAEVRELDA